MRILILMASLAIVRLALAEPTSRSPALAIDQQPAALRLIRTAEQVYVFRVTVTENRRGEVTPHGDYKRARAIDSDARRKLGHLLGKDSSWCHCFDNTFGVGPEAKYVGFIVQKGKDKLVLLRFLRWHTKGIFNGERTSESLEEAASDKLDEWEKRYAKPERGLK
jgi:hypothetical protein